MNATGILFVQSSIDYRQIKKQILENKGFFSSQEGEELLNIN